MVKISSFRIYFMFILALFFYFYEYALQITPSVMTEPLMRDLDIGVVGIGALMSFFFFPYTLLQIPAGVLFDGFNSRYVLGFSVLFCALGSIAFALSDTFILALLGRMFIGAGSAFAFLGVIIVASQWFSPKWYASLIGIGQLMGCFGAIAGEKLYLILMDSIGWQSSLYLLAIAGLILAALSFFVITEPPNVKKTPIEWRVLMQKFSMLFKNKHLRGAAAYTFCIWGPVTSFATLWGVPFVQTAYQTDVSFAATICSMLWLGSAFGSPLLGWLSDMIEGSRRFFMNLCGLVGTLTAILIVYWHVDNMVLLGCMFFVFGMSTGGQALSFAYLRDHIDDSDIGAASGINNMATVAGGSILPILIGSIIHWSWDGQLDGVNDIPRYQGIDYQWALFVIPLCHFMALIISYFWLGSTRKLNEVKQAT